MSATIMKLEDYTYLKKSTRDTKTSGEADVILMPHAQLNVQEMQDFLNEIIQSCHPGEHDCAIESNA